MDFVMCVARGAIVRHLLDSGWEVRDAPTVRLQALQGAIWQLDAELLLTSSHELRDEGCELIRMRRFHVANRDAAIQGASQHEGAYPNLFGSKKKTRGWSAENERCGRRGIAFRAAILCARASRAWLPCMPRLRERGT